MAALEYSATKLGDYSPLLLGLLHHQSAPSKVMDYFYYYSSYPFST